MFKKLMFALSLIMVLILPTGIASAGPGKYDGQIRKPNGQIEYYKISQLASSLSLSKNSVVGFASGCKGITYGVTYYNATGGVDMGYSQTVNWCYNGTKITSVSHTHNPVISQPLMKYNGLLADTHSGGVNSTSYTAYSEASMCEFTPGFGCVWYRYPQVTETVHGNGTFSSNVVP